MLSRRRLKITRDGTLFFLGILGVAYETLVTNVERPALLILFAGMMGLPAFLQKDESDSNESNKDSR